MRLIFIAIAIVGGLIAMSVVVSLQFQTSSAEYKVPCLVSLDSSLMEWGNTIEEARNKCISFRAQLQASAQSAEQLTAIMNSIKAGMH